MRAKKIKKPQSAQSSSGDIFPVDVAKIREAQTMNHKS
jgi:hypothetical protein